MRDAAAAPGPDLVQRLRQGPQDQVGLLFLKATTPRTRHSIAEQIEAHAFAAHCQISLAESRGIAARWTDGIVSGTAEQLTQFLTTVRPVLDRAHGTASLVA